MVEFDSIPLTRGVQKGWLKGIAGDEGVNDVNAPYKINALGIKVETTKSTSSVDYNELIEVRTVDAHGKEQSVRGTIIGKNADPRIVEVDGESIEARPVDTLLVVRNLDKPGIVGKVVQYLENMELILRICPLADRKVPNPPLPSWNLIVSRLRKFSKN